MMKMIKGRREAAPRDNAPAISATSNHNNDPINDSNNSNRNNSQGRIDRQQIQEDQPFDHTQSDIGSSHSDDSHSVGSRSSATSSSMDDGRVGGRSAIMVEDLDDGELPALMLKKNSSSLLRGHTTRSRPLSPPSLAGSMRGPHEATKEPTTHQQLRKVEIEQRKFWGQLDGSRQDDDDEDDLEVPAAVDTPNSDDDDDGDDDKQQRGPDDEIAGALSSSPRLPSTPPRTSINHHRETERKDSSMDILPDETLENQAQASSTNFCSQTLSALGDMCGTSLAMSSAGADKEDMDNEPARIPTGYRRKHPLPVDDQQEHTAIEVEFVEPPALRSLSSDRKNAYLTAMARKAKADYARRKDDGGNTADGEDNDNYGDAGRDAQLPDDELDQDNASLPTLRNLHPDAAVMSHRSTPRAPSAVKKPDPPPSTYLPDAYVIPDGETVYATFSKTEKRKFLGLINAGVSPAAASQQVQNERQRQNEQNQRQRGSSEAASTAGGFGFLGSNNTKKKDAVNSKKAAGKGSPTANNRNEKTPGRDEQRRTSRAVLLNFFKKAGSPGGRDKSPSPTAHQDPQPTVQQERESQTIKALPQNEEPTRGGLALAYAVTPEIGALSAPEMHATNQPNLDANKEGLSELSDPIVNTVEEGEASVQKRNPDEETEATTGNSDDEPRFARSGLHSYNGARRNYRVRDHEEKTQKSPLPLSPGARFMAATASKGNSSQDNNSRTLSRMRSPRFSELKERRSRSAPRDMPFRPSMMMTSRSSSHFASRETPEAAMDHNNTSGTSSKTEKVQNIETTTSSAVAVESRPSSQGEERPPSRIVHSFLQQPRFAEQRPLDEALGQIEREMLRPSQNGKVPSDNRATAAPAFPVVAVEAPLVPEPPPHMEGRSRVSMNDGTLRPVPVKATQGGNQLELSDFNERQRQQQLDASPPIQRTLSAEHVESTAAFLRDENLRVLAEKAFLSALPGLADRPATASDGGAGTVLSDGESSYVGRPATVAGDGRRDLMSIKARSAHASSKSVSSSNFEQTAKRIKEKSVFVENPMAVSMDQYLKAAGERQPSVTSGPHSISGFHHDAVSVYTLGTNITGGGSTYTQSSRLRRPGAAKTRLAQAKQIDKNGSQKRPMGWHESIRAAAASNNRLWDPKAGWVDYEDPDADGHTFMSDPIKSKEKIHVGLTKSALAKKTKESDDGNKVSRGGGEPVPVPFPSEWEQERKDMLESSVVAARTSEQRVQYPQFASLDSRSSSVTKTAEHFSSSYRGSFVEESDSTEQTRHLRVSPQSLQLEGSDSAEVPTVSSRPNALVDELGEVDSTEQYPSGYGISDIVDLDEPLAAILSPRSVRADYGELDDDAVNVSNIAVIAESIEQPDLVMKSREHVVHPSGLMAYTRRSSPTYERSIPFKDEEHETETDRESQPQEPLAYEQNDLANKATNDPSFQTNVSSRLPASSVGYEREPRLMAIPLSPLDSDHRLTQWIARAEQSPKNFSETSTESSNKAVASSAGVPSERYVQLGDNGSERSAAAVAKSDSVGDDDDDDVDSKPSSQSEKENGERDFEMSNDGGLDDESAVQQERSSSPFPSYDDRALSPVVGLVREKIGKDDLGLFPPQVPQPQESINGTNKLGLPVRPKLEYSINDNAHRQANATMLVHDFQSASDSQPPVRKVEASKPAFGQGKGPSDMFLLSEPSSAIGNSHKLEAQQFHATQASSLPASTREVSTGSNEVTVRIAAPWKDSPKRNAQSLASDSNQKHVAPRSVGVADLGSDLQEETWQGRYSSMASGQSIESYASYASPPRNGPGVSRPAPVSPRTPNSANSYRRGAGPVDVDEVDDTWDSDDERQHSSGWENGFSGGSRTGTSISGNSQFSKKVPKLKMNARDTSPVSIRRGAEFPLASTTNGHYENHVSSGDESNKIIRRVRSASPPPSPPTPPSRTSSSDKVDFDQPIRTAGRGSDSSPSPAALESQQMQRHYEEAGQSRDFQALESSHIQRQHEEAGKRRDFQASESQQIQRQYDEAGQRRDFQASESQQMPRQYEEAGHHRDFQASESQQMPRHYEGSRQRRDVQALDSQQIQRRYEEAGQRRDFQTLESRQMQQRYEEVGQRRDLQTLGGFPNHDNANYPKHLHDDAYYPEEMDRQEELTSYRTGDAAKSREFNQRPLSPNRDSSMNKPPQVHNPATLPSVRTRLQQWESLASKSEDSEDLARKKVAEIREHRIAATAEWKSFLGKKVQEESAAAARQSASREMYPEQNASQNSIFRQAPEPTQPDEANHPSNNSLAPEQHPSNSRMLEMKYDESVRDQIQPTILTTQGDQTERNRIRMDGDRGRRALKTGRHNGDRRAERYSRGSPHDDDSLFDFVDRKAPVSPGRHAIVHGTEMGLHDVSPIPKTPSKDSSDDEAVDEKAKGAAIGIRRHKEVEDDEDDDSISYDKDPSEAYGPGPNSTRSFFQRLAECAAPVMPAKYDTSKEPGAMPSAHLAFLRSNPQTTTGKQPNARFVPPALCGRPDIIAEEESEEEAVPNRRASEERPRAASEIIERPRSKSVGRTPSVISDEFGAKTAYLEAIAMRTAVSRPRSSSRRRERSSASSAASSTTSSIHSEKWKAFLERKRSGGSNTAKSRNGSTSDVSKAAEKYAADKVDEMMLRMKPRQQYGRYDDDYRGTIASDAMQVNYEPDSLRSAEDLAAARVEAMMAALSISEPDEGEI